MTGTRCKRALRVRQLNKRGQQQMSDEVSPPSRFLVRKGCKGWMGRRARRNRGRCSSRRSYDRQRKGPAMVGTDPAVNLAKEQASLEQRIAAVTNSTANLVSQLRELDEVREQVREALLSQIERTEGLLIFPV